MQYRTYNTGDQLWVRRTVDGHEVTAKLITSDGLTWEEGDEKSLTQLTGVEKVLNECVVAAIRLNHWVMNS